MSVSRMESTTAEAGGDFPQSKTVTTTSSVRSGQPCVSASPDEGMAASARSKQRFSSCPTDRDYRSFGLRIHHEGREEHEESCHSLWSLVSLVVYFFELCCSAIVHSLGWPNRHA